MQSENTPMEMPYEEQTDEKAVVRIGPDGKVTCAKNLATGCGYKAGDKVCGKCGAMAVMTKEDDEEMMEEEDDAIMLDDPDEEKMGMGVDPEELRRMRGKAGDGYLCGETREVKGAGEAPCGNCSGGCCSDSGIDLQFIEALAEKTIEGSVLDSGYSSDHDLFVVTMERKDGQTIEAFFTGDGELDGWFRIPDAGQDVAIDIQTAVKVALETVEGKALNYSVGNFEGIESYVIEVEGLNGKSYDVHINPVDGSPLGYDEYEWSVEDIADEKAMYSTEERMAMAERGQALEDGSYPIKNVSDLKNAIQAYGRAKDKAKAKAHIVKRAKELGAENLIPEEWGDEVPNTDKPMAGKTAEGEFAASLMEFELLAAEEDLRDLLND